MVCPLGFTSWQSVRSHLHIELLPCYRATREITTIAERLQLPQRLSPHQTPARKLIAKDFSKEIFNFLQQKVKEQVAIISANKRHH